MNASTVVGQVYVAVATYIAVGVMFYFTFTVLQREWLMNLIARASRLIPGFADGFHRGANSFGFGSEADLMRQVYTVLVWPYAVLSLAVLSFLVSRVEKTMERMTHKDIESALENEVAALRGEVIGERILQVRDVFAKERSEDEQLFLRNFFEKMEKVFPGKKFADGVVNGEASVEYSMPLDPPRARDIFVKFEFHREVQISSAGLFQVRPFVEVQIFIARYDKNGVLVAKHECAPDEGPFAISKNDVGIDTDSSLGAWYIHDTFENLNDDEESDIVDSVTGEMLTVLNGPLKTEVAA